MAASDSGYAMTSHLPPSDLYQVNYDNRMLKTLTNSTSFEMNGKQMQ